MKPSRVQSYAILTGSLHLSPSCILHLQERSAWPRVTTVKPSIQVCFCQALFSLMKEGSNSLMYRCVLKSLRNLHNSPLLLIGKSVFKKNTILLITQMSHLHTEKMKTNYKKIINTKFIWISVKIPIV